MSREPRDEPDLRQALTDQLARLGRSARSFDEGRPDVRRQESHTLATGIAILVHDHGQSKALLAQVGRLDELRVESTGTGIDLHNVMTQHPLVLLDSDGEYIPVSQMPQRSGKPTRTLPFHEWWAEPVIAAKHPVYQLQQTHTRSELVLDVRNTDGGSHVDPGLPPKYAYLSRRNALGWEMIDGDPPSSPPVESGNPVPATLRQIWSELDRAIGRFDHGSES